MRLLILLMLAGALLTAGCDDETAGAAAPAPPAEPEGPRTQSPLPDGHVPITPPDGDDPNDRPPGAGGQGEGEGELDPPEPPTGGRTARRLSVDALRRSIPALFGGIGWTLEVNQGGQRREVDLFSVLARTLGEPDYIEVTEENAQPSPLFAKFMDDMAGSVCSQAVERDGEGGADGLVIRHPDDADANLRFLRLKLHSIHVPADSSEGIAGLRGLYDALLNDTGKTNDAWYGVCVAMVTAPELMGY